MEGWLAQLGFGGGAQQQAAPQQPAPPAPPQPRRITLCLSEMGLPAIPGLGKAVHSSILVDNIEYEFNGQGIVRCQGPQSHQKFSKKTEMIDMGTSMRGGTAMMNSLSQYFAAGTYDLLRKNCNTFSDCALFYLTGQRMNAKYRALEKVGESIDKWTPIIGTLFKGYKKNPYADAFKTVDVVNHIEGQRQVSDASSRPPAPAHQAGYPAAPKAGYPQSPQVAAPADVKAKQSKGFYKLAAGKGK